jgi:hypothetical protein
MDFSEESLHTIEKDVETTIAELMNDVDVSSLSDITWNILSKLNKAPLQKYLANILSLYQKNINLCRSAAAKLDQLKDEQIVLQKQLIDCQSEQINSVQKTVKTEMKTWADVARRNVTQNKVLTATTVKEAVRAVNEEEERSKNLIIYGVAEDKNDLVEKDCASNEKLHEIVKSVRRVTLSDDSLPVQGVKVYRLGKKAPNSNRPIKVEFQCSGDVENILKNAHKLKAKDDLKSVYVSPDRTKEQRAEHSKLVKQMKQMISTDGSKHYFIRDNKVNCVDKRVRD